MYYYLKVLRPHQWVKNLFVFLPAFFNGSILNWTSITECIIGFISFCFISSSIYCLNDLKDVEYDRIHPEKCKRPLAAGKVSPSVIKILIPLLMTLAIGINFLLPVRMAIKMSSIILIYFISNIAYTFYLKKYSLIDVTIIAIGFVLRIIDGAISTDVVLSPWILIMVFLLALFLAFAKRRDDVLKMSKLNIIVRSNVKDYNLNFLNQILGMLGSVIIVCYIMYTMSPDVIERYNGKYIVITTFFVILAIIRYLQISLVTEKTGSPTKILLKDTFILGCIMGWITLFFYLIYF